MTSNQKRPVDADDDLDDLDDVLNQFDTDPHSHSVSAPATSGRPRTNTRVDKPPFSTPGSGLPTIDPTDEVDEDALTADFAKELALGMENLMKELSSDGKQDKDGIDDDDKRKAMLAAWEAMLIEGMDATTSKEDESADTNNPASEGSSDFQKKIKETLSRLKESESNVQAKAGSSVDSESFESLLSSLGSLGDGDENLTDLLEQMMTQLMTKEVLYDPIKELCDKFPPYLENPPQPITDEDKRCYEQQLELARKICQIFESPAYSDSDQEKTKEIVDLMSKMQSLGSPPEAVMGPLPTGLGADGMPEGCVIS